MRIFKKIGLVVIGIIIVIGVVITVLTPSDSFVNFLVGIMLIEWLIKKLTIVYEEYHKKEIKNI
jgi:hypothetical protein